MGGLAVTIEWSPNGEASQIDAMMRPIAHRSSAGVATHRTRRAALAQGFTRASENQRVATAGALSIVGDARLYDHRGLEGIAGDTDLERILATFAEHGMAMLNRLDGDYAFVIWNDEEATALAVRDRFAVKPLFYEETESGIRFASEAKQLITTSGQSPRPDMRSVAEYITYDFKETTHTFFEGIRRVRPSHALIAGSEGIRHHRYWTPRPDRSRHRPADLPNLFKEHLTSAVERRIRSADRVVSQLSGGLDSTSIAAAAASLVPGLDATRFVTVSAVYPGMPGDESDYINDVVERQPFPHEDFIPRVGTFDDFEHDRWIVDGPFIDVIRDMSVETARIANDRGAQLVFTGNGGDHLLNQAHLIADSIRRGNLTQAINRARSESSWRGPSTASIATRTLRQLTPQRIREVTRPFRTQNGVSTVARVPVPNHANPRSLGLESKTQNTIAADLTDPIFSWTNESQEATFASHGVELAHPFLDITLVEFVLSIHPSDIPFDGRTKTLARQAFASDLPESVLSRKWGAIADDYLDAAFADMRTAMRTQYADPPATAASIIDRDVYRRTVDRFDQGELTPYERHSFMRTWLAFQWLDSLWPYTQNRE